VPSPGGPLVGLGQRDWNGVLTRTLGPSFYSLPRRWCYARHGVDRQASRHAGRTPASTSLPCSMEVQPCPCHLRPVIRLRH
jgi:hypothetical protein